MSNTPSVPQTEFDARTGKYVEVPEGPCANIPEPAARPVPELKTYQVEIRFGPQMMSATAEIKAEDVGDVLSQVFVQGGLRLITKLPTTASMGNSFQLGAFVMVSSIHSIVVLSETKS